MQTSRGNVHWFFSKDLLQWFLLACSLHARDGFLFKFSLKSCMKVSGEMQTVCNIEANYATLKQTKVENFVCLVLNCTKSFCFLTRSRQSMCRSWSSQSCPVSMMLTAECVTLAVKLCIILSRWPGAQSCLSSIRYLMDSALWVTYSSSANISYSAIFKVTIISVVSVPFLQKTVWTSSSVSDSCFDHSWLQTRIRMFEVDQNCWIDSWRYIVSLPCSSAHHSVTHPSFLTCSSVSHLSLLTLWLHLWVALPLSSAHHSVNHPSFLTCSSVSHLSLFISCVSHHSLLSCSSASHHSLLTCSSVIKSGYVTTFLSCVLLLRFPKPWLAFFCVPQDIVTESCAFDMVAFMPLVRARIYTNSPYARQFLVSWVGHLLLAAFFPAITKSQCAHRRQEMGACQWLAIVKGCNSFVGSGMCQEALVLRSWRGSYLDLITLLLVIPVTSDRLASSDTKSTGQLCDTRLMSFFAICSRLWLWTPFQI